MYRYLSLSLSLYIYLYLSSSLFGLFGLVGIAIQILLYADDIVLIFDSPEGLQKHLNALKLFCTDKGLSINMDTTEVMVFTTNQAWVPRLEPKFFLGEEKVEYTRSYTYLGVTFTWPRFSLWEATCARLSCGCAALDALEGQSAHLQFQKPRTME